MPSPILTVTYMRNRNPLAKQRHRAKLVVSGRNVGGPGEWYHDKRFALVSQLRHLGIPTSARVEPAGSPDRFRLVAGSSPAHAYYDVYVLGWSRGEVVAALTTMARP